MKRILFLFVSLSCLFSYGQSNHATIKTVCFVDTNPIKGGIKLKFSLLKGTGILNCSYYFNDAKINKVPIALFNEDFNGDRIDESTEEINKRFFHVANVILGKNDSLPFLSNKKPSRYALKLYVTKGDDDGEHELLAMLIDTEECKVICQSEYKGEGGMFGSLVNLLGDAAENIAKR